MINKNNIESVQKVYDSGQYINVQNRYTIRRGKNSHGEAFFHYSELFLLHVLTNLAYNSGIIRQHLEAHFARVEEDVLEIYIMTRNSESMSRSTCMTESFLPSGQKVKCTEISKNLTHTVHHPCCVTRRGFKLPNNESLKGLKAKHVNVLSVYR